MNALPYCPVCAGPIPHKFRPDPLHPSECAICGNRAEKHVQ
jgi:hypothetical protein